MVKPNDGMCHMMDDDVTSNPDGTIDYTSWAKLVRSLTKITHSTLHYTYTHVCIYVYTPSYPMVHVYTYYVHTYSTLLYLLTCIFPMVLYVWYPILICTCKCRYMLSYSILSLCAIHSMHITSTPVYPTYI